ncbi:hydantoinase/oxoprolinase family protein [Lactiplantibacillus xiangfangensis]|nr:hydantoinase/oxoprolinase family protein [Lactiplantibacillus xiangfangensis]
MGRKVRIGIDVGGTFTDAVAIDDETYEIVNKIKIPTTHEEGVAVGIVRIIKELLAKGHIAPEDVVFIAHGTTQATNALLEGDVASVGIIGMGTGLDGKGAQKETKVPPIELAPKKFLKTESRFLDSGKLTEQLVSDTIDDLKKDNCEVMVASEAYSVDDPTNELAVIDVAQKKGLYATGGHEISELYGLKMRTRTAVINASLIPKMMQTANMTEQAVIDTNIKSNLMIMRCDGGVMSINEVRKRPILTMLSGLAAGVAGALMYEKVSDGIFFEVGGTSVDISVIKNGKVMIKYAQVGGHKTYLRSLDVRTLGVAGGSMVRITDGKIVDVGPRSAHIANLDYECFTPADQFSHPTVEYVSPRPSDPAEYAVVKTDEGVYSYTLAGAANLLGYVPDDDYAHGIDESNAIAWEALGQHLGITGKEAARQVVDRAIAKLSPTIQDLIADYDLDPHMVTFIGGGGSASIVTPPLAEAFKNKFKIAKNAPYISTIGVALAMVREQIERSLTNPTDQDIKQIRADVIEKITQSGANEDTVDVNIEIDAQHNVVRAVATGATELRQKNFSEAALDEQQYRELAANALGADINSVGLDSETGRWKLLNATTVSGMLFFKRKKTDSCVIDREGVIRFKQKNTFTLHCKKNEVDDALVPFIDDHTTYSDANATIPKVFLFYKEKMLDLTGMQTIEQLMSIVDVELEMVKDDDHLIAVAYK